MASPSDRGLKQAKVRNAAKAKTRAPMASPSDRGLKRAEGRRAAEVEPQAPMASPSDRGLKLIPDFGWTGEIKGSNGLPER